MLAELFNQILLMSLVASALYFILKLFGRLTKKHFTASWNYFTHVAAITFFLIPYHKIASLLGLKFTKQIESSKFEQLSSFIAPNSAVITNAATSYNPAKVKTGQDILQYFIEIAPYVWIAGTFLFILCILLQSAKLNRRILKTCEQAKDVQMLKELEKCKKKLNIKKEILLFIAPIVTTPFLSGLFKPRIIMPEMEFTNEEYRQVFLHELTHFKRRDVWIKYLMVFIYSLHWFNPLAYMARRDADQFCELSCDESIVKSMNINERRQYCQLLLSVLWNVADQKAKLFSAFSEKQYIERRIDMILKNEGAKRKNKVRVLVLAMVLLMASISVVSAANASFAGKADSVVPISKDVDATAQNGTLVSPSNGLNPAQAEVAAKSEVHSYAADGITPFATVTWPDTKIAYNTEMRFISSETGGYFIIRKGIQATFSFDIKGGNSENFRVAWKDKNGNLTTLFEGSASSKSVTYTPSSDVEGNFFVWNKAVAAITLTNISLSY